MTRPTLKQTYVLVVAMLTLALMATPQLVEKPVYINLSPSLSTGLYRPVAPKFTRGELLIFDVPDSVRELAIGRGWLHRGRTLLIKPIAANSGMSVCLSDRTLYIANTAVAPVALTDSRGLPLPQLQGCWLLNDDEVFVASFAPNSFDSRYFGPIKVGSVIAAAEPLFTFNKME